MGGEDVGSPLCPWAGGTSSALGDSTRSPASSRPGVLAQVPGGGSSATSSFFSISHLATFLSEKLAGEPLLALGIRIIQFKCKHLCLQHRA